MNECSMIEGRGDEHLTQIYTHDPSPNDQPASGFDTYLLIFSAMLTLRSSP